MSDNHSVGDIVKVMWMPERRAVDRKDYTNGLGIVEEVIDDGKRVLVQMLKPSGERNGALFVPVDSLAHVNDADAQVALAAYQRVLQDEAREEREWRAVRRRHVQAVADNHNLGVEQVIAILDDVLGYDAQFYY